MSARREREAANRSQSAIPERINPASLPPPMRRAYERYREVDGRQYPKGDGSQGARLDTNFRPQNRGAVSKRARNQIERKTIPNYCKLFNEFPPYALRLTFDPERADERKLARL